MLKTSLKRFGLWPVIVGVTLISIAVSLVIAALVHVLVLGEPMPPVAWALCIVCPLVLAPTMSVASFSLLLQLDRAHDKLRISNDTDYLTGVHNRRYFMDSLRREVSRGGAPFSVALIDVDNFKAVNDQHGHLAGDEVLRALARRCGAMLRERDTFARFGGEEFAVLLPHTDMADALGWLERLRAEVAALQVELAGERLSITVTVTVSIGVVSAGPGTWLAEPEVDAVLRIADEALYRAKREGKNRVALHGQLAA
jgi:diguanylate cyclase (GGDEF)-like protein